MRRDPTASGLTHLSEDQLARFEDGDPTAAEARHLEICPGCRGRLQDRRAASAAYVEYRDVIRGPLLPELPRPWPSLDSLLARSRMSEPRRLFRWWPAAALAAGFCALLGLVVAATFYYQSRQSPTARASRLLARSAKIALPTGRFISVRLGGRMLVRPAVLISDSPNGSDPETTRLEKMFTAAHYSWREPVSSESFQDWRKGLSQKQDFVSMLEEGGRRSYRVRTETPTGELRSASLVLQAEDLHPVDAAFDFDQVGTVDISQTSAPVEAPPRTRLQTNQPNKATPVESPVGPEDTLHVLAALDHIGADVGEPIEVSQDSRHLHVMVRGYGLTDERRKEVEDALKSLPRVTTDFENGTAAPAYPPSAPTQSYATNIPAPLRQQFERAFGGASAFQEVTDRVLEASASALARSHSLEELARNFPPQTEGRLGVRDRELLESLRQLHVAELSRLEANVWTDLKPVVGTTGSTSSPRAQGNGSGTGWQAGIPELLSSVQTVDRALNRLLAGSYPQVSGEEMLRALPSQLGELESAIQFQRVAGR
jgi:hypothetical protein